MLLIVAGGLGQLGLSGRFTCNDSTIQFDVGDDTPSSPWADLTCIEMAGLPIFLPALLMLAVGMNVLARQKLDSIWLSLLAGGLLGAATAASTAWFLHELIEDEMYRMLLRHLFLNQHFFLPLMMSGALLAALNWSISVRPFRRLRMNPSVGDD